MNRDEVFSKVVEIIKDVFDNDDLEISNDTVAKDVEGWDSLNLKMNLISLLQWVKFRDFQMSVNLSILLWLTFHKKK